VTLMLMLTIISVC